MLPVRHQTVALNPVDLAARNGEYRLNRVMA